MTQSVELRQRPPQSGKTVHFWQLYWQLFGMLRKNEPDIFRGRTSVFLMSRASNSSDNSPEFAVSRETISAFFHPPLAKSTFYDLMTQGKITPMEVPKGMYKLNATLKRLGLKPVAALPRKTSERSIQDIVRFAFSLLDPKTFPTPSWVMYCDDIPFRDQQQAIEMADLFRADLESFRFSSERSSYAAGVLDAYFELESQNFSI